MQNMWHPSCLSSTTTTNSLFNFQQKLRVYMICFSVTECLRIFFLDFEWKNKLRYVRIYFDTPIFDRIVKDRAAKFVDMLSAIGGTMGLLTGFSIISAVELAYFTVKFMYDTLLKKNLGDYFK